MAVDRSVDEFYRRTKRERERALWACIGGDDALTDAWTRMHRDAFVRVCVFGDSCERDLHWFDSSRQRAASLRIELVRDCVRNDSRIRVQVSATYANFFDDDAGKNADDDDDERAPLVKADATHAFKALNAPSIMSVLHKQDVRSHIVLCDTAVCFEGRSKPRGVSDVAPAPRWNRDAKRLVMGALRRWRVLHKAVKPCIVCGRLGFLTALCPSCESRRCISNWLRDDGEAGMTSATSFSGREWATLYAMNTWATQHASSK
jgi:hypothetical protein